MKKKVVRMAVSNNMPVEKILDRYPDLSYADIEEAVGEFLEKRNGLDARDGCMGSKEEAYWNDEWLYGTTYNPFVNLKFKHVEKEKGNTA